MAGLDEAKQPRSYAEEEQLGELLGRRSEAAARQQVAGETRAIEQQVAEQGRAAKQAEKDTKAQAKEKARAEQQHAKDAVARQLAEATAAPPDGVSGAARASQPHGVSGNTVQPYSGKSPKARKWPLKRKSP